MRRGCGGAPNSQACEWHALADLGHGAFRVFVGTEPQRSSEPVACCFVESRCRIVADVGVTGCRLRLGDALFVTPLTGQEPTKLSGHTRSCHGTETAHGFNYGRDTNP